VLGHDSTSAGLDSKLARAEPIKMPWPGWWREHWVGSTRLVRSLRGVA
jgi:hypothetical protein